MEGFFPFLSSVRAHELIIPGGCNHWWLWHPCSLIWQEIFHFSIVRHKFKCGNETHSEIAEEIKLMMGIKGHVLVMCMQIIKICSFVSLNSLKTCRRIWSYLSPIFSLVVSQSESANCRFRNYLNFKHPPFSPKPFSLNMGVKRYSEGVTSRSYGGYNTLSWIPKILMSPSVPFPLHWEALS